MQIFFLHFTLESKSCCFFFFLHDFARKAPAIFTVN
jgi:hypothetical protein